MDNYSVEKIIVENPSIYNGNKVLEIIITGDCNIYEQELESKLFNLLEKISKESLSYTDNPYMIRALISDPRLTSFPLTGVSYIVKNNELELVETSEKARFSLLRALID
jgi:hypothetical protein